MHRPAHPSARSLPWLLALSLLVPACQGPRHVRIPAKGAAAVDSGGRAIERVQAGSTLYVTAGALEPGALYEFRLGVDALAPSIGEAVSFARVTADARGRVAPFALWFHSGVVGCSLRSEPRNGLPPFTYRTFDEAEAALAGRRLVVGVHRVESSDGERDPLSLHTGEALHRLELPVEPRRAPMLFPSDETGCLMNAAESGTRDLFVSGRGFAPGEVVQLAVVPNQRDWRVGDSVIDLARSQGGEALRVTAGKDGRFTARVWDRDAQRRGAYDLVALRDLERRRDLRRLGPEDLVSYASDTAFLLFLRYPVGGPTMDIAGRKVSGFPYFEFADSFARQGDTVWGAVDPTYVPAGHPGGTYAAYYVVPHRDVNGWDPMSGGATNLVDVSGGIEIQRVKAGCINGTDVPIWEPTPALPLPVGEYDVVVDFGPSPADTATTYATDGQYDALLDFLDGADQVGFVVVEDPYELGTFAIGEAEYSTDDFFTTLLNASDVDLRAVVRYPATVAGVDTPVAAGAHPLFLIEHGNHSICEDGTWNHAACTDRTPNHEGYMRLLEILASHGVIAVSIDAYDLTGWVSQWIAERGTLILKHIELWSHLNDTSTFTSYTDYFAGRFAAHVDMSRISVSGHSRGGEASVAAYMLNTAFNIGSVSSIAPVDGQSYVLPDVPYFVILPAADGDVTSLGGQKIYDRAGSGLVPVDGSEKSAIFTYGANHNFFNTVWADDGDDYVDKIDDTVVRADFIPKADQQRLGEAYLAAFARIHLLGETVYRDMLRGKLTFPSTAGFKNHHERHEPSHSRLESGAGTLPTPSGLTATGISNPFPHQTQALRITWNSSGDELVYSVPAAQRDASGFEVLSFRVAQSGAASNPAGADQELRVELEGGGNVKAVYASRLGQIPPPYERPDLEYHVMTTVRIPLHSFILNNSGVTLENIDTIRLTFFTPSQGEIHVDDIEFSR